MWWTYKKNMKSINKIKIGSKWVGQGKPCFIIAELGVNHNGDIDIAKKMIIKV